jgi:hypothetical protein
LRISIIFPIFDWWKIEKAVNQQLTQIALFLCNHFYLRSVLASIYSYAHSVSTGQDGGLLGFILLTAVYLLDYEHAFVPYVHPGPPPAANAAHGAWSAYNNAMSL